MCKVKSPVNAVELFRDGVEKCGGGDLFRGALLPEQAQVAGHGAFPDHVQAGGFQMIGKFLEFWEVVLFTALPQGAAPGEDGGNGVGGGFLTF